MKDNRKKKIWFDVAIMAVSCLWVLAAWYLNLSTQVIQISLIAAILTGGIALIDCFRQMGSPDSSQAGREQAATGFPAHELVLINEEEKPIRAWDLTGKTAMVIGRKSRDEQVDVDLGDCEYGALINVQHAVLNYSLDTWYLEDLGSQNGIQIKKVEDGKRYQVAPNHPCRVSAGDVIYIAKTKLLFT